MENKLNEQLSELEMAELTQLVGWEATRVADVGDWPEWMKSTAKESLLSRVPTVDSKASGFDAGIACTLDLIPRSKQVLSAALHAAYTPDKVAQVIKEMENIDADSETVWWLAACSVCDEGGVM